MDQMKMIAGLFIGGGIGGSKSLVEKRLSWHIPTLQAANSGGMSIFKNKNRALKNVEIRCT